MKCPSAPVLHYLHGGAHGEGELTEWRLQDVNQRHGNEDLLRIQDVLFVDRDVDAEHGEGNLRTQNQKRTKKSKRTDLALEDALWGF